MTHSEQDNDVSYRLARKTRLRFWLNSACRWDNAKIPAIKVAVNSYRNGRIVLN